MSQQQFHEHSTFDSKIDSGLRAVDLALERTLTGNIEKRPIHDIINRQKSLQLFSITPIGQVLIPLCSPAGVYTADVPHVTMGSGPANIDGNALDHGGSVELKDGTVLRN